MPNDDPSSEHVTLETQRRRSNVYAFRRLKWGKPERLRSSSAPSARPSRNAPLPLRRGENGQGLNTWLLVAIGVTGAVLVITALG